MTDKTFKDYLKEDSVDMEKHNTLNDIFQALEQLNTEIDELDALDSDMDSSGVGDLTDQLTTMRKHVEALYQVLDRSGRIVPMDAQDRAGDEDRDAKRISDSVNEAVDQALIDSVVDQIMRDIEMGDQTAIEELLMSCPEANLRSFLSDIEESAELNEIKKLKRLAGLGNNYNDPGEGPLPTTIEPGDPVGQGGITTIEPGDPTSKGFPSSEDHARDMLQGIKGGPKPGTPEFEKLVQQLTDPSLGAGFIPGKGFAKGPDDPTLGMYDPKDVEDILNKPKPTLPKPSPINDLMRRAGIK